MELGFRVNKTMEAISHIELGKSLPQIDTLVDIAKELSIPIIEFFDGYKNKKKTGKSKNRIAKEMELLSMIETLNDENLDLAKDLLQSLIKRG